MIGSSNEGAVFGDYAGFYDALYADKDYDAECAFLDRVFSERGLTCSASILDLGAGTGGHDIPLARLGYTVTGVDRSARMLGIAREKAGADLSVEFVLGDIRDARVGRTFDAVISMFAVMSYQLTNDDLLAAFRTARAHLAPGGVFVFDGWFGPAVLADQPKVVTKTVTMPGGDLIEREARPTLDPVAQTVQVTYDVSSQRGSVVERTHEVHTMRFLFAQEVAYFLQIAGFEVVELMPFMAEGRTPSEDDWNVMWVARAI